MTNDPVAQATQWVAVCSLCGGHVHEDSPVLPRRPLPNDPDRYCAACHGDLMDTMVEGDDSIRLCLACDGEGVVRKVGAWDYCPNCDGDGVIGDDAA